jgi:signal transduction histidine kinase
MLRSLAGRLVLLLALLILAAIAAGGLMVGLFRQSTSAQIGQADAQIGRACDAIANAYRFYSAGWQQTTPASEDLAFRRGLTAVIQTALRSRPGVEGGIWQHSAGSLAYAYPTYEGAGPKTDLPQAEIPRIREINQTASEQARLVNVRYAARSQSLLIAACPLPGPIPGLSAWTMTRVVTFAGRAYQQLMAGLAVLLATVLAAAVLLTRLTWNWSRHVGRIEAALAGHDIAELPRLATTGERELDRIVVALNDAGSRLADARTRAADLARQIATGERLAAIGRVAAGVAHEIRNPLAAMRLKAENALAAGGERPREALSVIVSQISRLDVLVRRLLHITERDDPHRQSVALGPFIEECFAAHAELARAKEVSLVADLDVQLVHIDPKQMQRALDNLLINAIQAAPSGTKVRVAAFVRGDDLVFAVHDEGEGPPLPIRDHLFEPFVTGRSDGTGLGLSIVREVAQAHGGSARFVGCGTETSFEIIIPWQ